MSASAKPVIETCQVQDGCYLSKLPPPPVSAFGGLVQVIVGKDEPKTFNIHRGLLAHYSEYFARAFGNPNWLEADGVVRLEEDDPDTFQLFQNFIYTGRLNDDTHRTPHIVYKASTGQRLVRLLNQEKEMDSDVVSRADAVTLTFTSLIKLAAFAEMRVIPTLIDTVTSLIGQKVMSEQYIPLGLIAHAAEHLPRHRDLHRLLKDIVIYEGNEEDFTSLRGLPLNFFADIALSKLVIFHFQQKTSTDSKAIQSMCTYHAR